MLISLGIMLAHLIRKGLLAPIGHNIVLSHHKHVTRGHNFIPTVHDTTDS